MCIQSTGDFFFFGQIFSFQGAEIRFCVASVLAKIILLIFRAKKNSFGSSYLVWKLQETTV